MAKKKILHCVSEIQAKLGKRGLELDVGAVERIVSFYASKFDGKASFNPDDPAEVLDLEKLDFMRSSVANLSVISSAVRILNLYQPATMSPSDFLKSVVYGLPSVDAPNSPIRVFDSIADSRMQSVNSFWAQAKASGMVEILDGDDWKRLLPFIFDENQADIDGASIAMREAAKPFHEAKRRASYALSESGADVPIRLIGGWLPQEFMNADYMRRNLTATFKRLGKEAKQNPVAFARKHYGQESGEIPNITKADLYDLAIEAEVRNFISIMTPLIDRDKTVFHERGQRQNKSTQSAVFGKRRDTNFYAFGKKDKDGTPAVDPLEQMLSNAYFGFISGHHGDPLDIRGATAQKLTDIISDTQTSKSFSIISELTDERVFHFRNSNSYIAAFEAFSGDSKLFPMLASSIGRKHELAAMYALLGDKPTLTLDLIRRGLSDFVRDDKRSKDKHRANNEIKAMDKLDFSLLLSIATGAFHTRDDSLWSHSGRILRALQVWAHLGEASVTAWAGDSALMTGQLIRQGMPVGDALMGHFEAFRNLSDVRAFTNYLGIGSEAVSGQNILDSRYGSALGQHGLVSRSGDLFAKITGLDWITDTHRRIMTYRTSALYGERAKRSWNDLTSSERSDLARYGLEESEWEILREHAVKPHDTRSGVQFLVLPELETVPASAFIGDKPRPIADIGRAKFLLRTKVLNMIKDNLDAGVPIPNVRTQYWTTGGFKLGTPHGEAWRLASQFLSIPLQVAAQIFPRDFGYNRAKGFNVDYGTMGFMLATTLFMGYLVNNVVEPLYEGKTPRYPRLSGDGSFRHNWDLATDSFTAGGFAGLYSDFLFKETYRDATSVFGPAVNDGSRLMFAMKDFAIGDFRKSGADFGALLVDNVPAANIFYARAALDYSILFWLREMFNEGAVERNITRLQNRGQSYPLAESWSNF